MPLNNCIRVRRKTTKTKENTNDTEKRQNTSGKLDKNKEIATCDIKEDKGILYIDLYQQFNLKKYKPLKTKYIRKIPIIPEIKDLLGFEHTRLSAFYKEYNSIKSMFENVEERNLTFHSLRHFFITNAKSKGFISAKVEYIAGHSLKKQEKVYTQFHVEDLQEIRNWQQETRKLILE